MIEPEQIKIVSLVIAAGITKIATTATEPFVGDNISKWIERGGTALTIALLIYACRALRIALADRQARLDSMHDEQVRQAGRNAEAREKLAGALDKLSDKLNK